MAVVTHPVSSSSRSLCFSELRFTTPPPQLAAAALSLQPDACLLQPLQGQFMSKPFDSQSQPLHPPCPRSCHSDRGHLAARQIREWPPLGWPSARRPPSKYCMGGRGGSLGLLPNAAGDRKVFKGRDRSCPPPDPHAMLSAI